MVGSKETMHKQIEDLEEKIHHLRVSRRVLMNLLEKMEQERKHELERLEKANRKLKKSNSQYAKDLIYKNRRIIELEGKIPK